MKPDSRIMYFQLWCLQTMVLEKTLESPLDSKEIKPINLKGNQPWIPLEGLILKPKRHCLTTWFKALTHWKRPWIWERLKTGGEGDDRGWDGWMASSTWWTWVWAGSGSWWWTGKPVVLQSMGSQRVRHDWVTELNWTSCITAAFMLASGYPGLEIMIGYYCTIKHTRAQPL